jgi:AcrR family transcriptional regulator
MRTSTAPEKRSRQAPSKAAEPRCYHHGDLRAALIETGMQLLERSSADGLSLREVARMTDVSPAAVYRHFPDKAALLSALAAEGLERLGRAQIEASKSAGHGIEGFTASGRAYVRFALTHPALFRLILSRAPSADYFATAENVNSSPMRFLRQNVKFLAPPGTSEKVLRAIALRAWSQVHGLAMLMLDGHVPNDQSIIDSIVDGRGIWQPPTSLPKRRGKLVEGV